MYFVLRETPGLKYFWRVLLGQILSLFPLTNKPSPNLIGVLEHNQFESDEGFGSDVEVQSWLN